MDLEVKILIELIKRYEPDFLISMSWGGYSALLAMADEPDFIKRALVASFSGKITAKMKNFIIKQDKILSNGDIHGAIKHFNSTLGFHIHRTIKKLYERYFSELGENSHVVEYLIRHFRDLLKMEPAKYLDKFSNIKARVMFLNGKLDDYTPGEYAHNLAAVIPQSTVKIVDGASHFLILENQKTAREVKGIIRDFFT
jgi:rhamnosyltransferase subunit A